MSEKEKKIKKKEEIVRKPLKYGIAPSLMVTLIREERAYRFEMPIGAQLDECIEACNEALNIVKKMKAESEAKAKKEEKLKKDTSVKEKAPLIKDGPSKKGK